MHTFFINTTGEHIEGFTDILEMQIMKKKLVMLDYPIGEWGSDTNGYKNCASRMGELIDTYKEIKNDFNVIVFVDLNAYEIYSKIPSTVNDRVEDRKACLKVLYSVFKYYMKATLWNALNNVGRTPNNFVILFEKNTKEADEFQTDIKAIDRQYACKILGLPMTIEEKNDTSFAQRDDEELGCSESGYKKPVYEHVDDSTALVQYAIAEVEKCDELKAVDFCKSLNAVCPDCKTELLALYENDVDTFLKDIKGKKDGPERSLIAKEKYRALINRIIKAGDNRNKKSESRNDAINIEGTNIYATEFSTNRVATETNHSESTRRDLCLAFYILDAVEDCDNLVKENKESHGFIVKDFSDIESIDWEAVIKHFNKKATIYRAAINNTENIKESYTKIKMAPELRLFDHKKFNMDEYGFIDGHFVITNKKEDEKDGESQVEGDADNNTKEDGVLESEIRKTTEWVSHKGHNLLSNVGFNEFEIGNDAWDTKEEKEPDYGLKADTAKKSESMSEKLEKIFAKIMSERKPRMSYDECVEESLQILKHNRFYMNKVRGHVSEVLSNYAGRSENNVSEVLTKRKVSVLDDGVIVDESRDYRYALGEGKDDAPLRNIKDTAKQAYTTALIEYVKFCAARSVALTSIKEQHDWFITKITQIKAAINKLKYMLFSVILAIAVLYIPYVYLQWEEITSSLLSLIICGVSVFAPVALAWIIMFFLKLLEQRRYAETLNAFKDKTEEALKDNDCSARHYDRLLDFVIPSLRWVYEYKLDVEFHEECCEMAAAKIAHHSQKLRQLRNSIRNIVNDLESYDFNDVEFETQKEETKISYQFPYCHKENEKIYTLVDKKTVDSFIKGGK